MFKKKMKSTVNKNGSSMIIFGWVWSGRNYGAVDKFLSSDRRLSNAVHYSSSFKIRIE